MTMIWLCLLLLTINICIILYRLNKLETYSDACDHNFKTIKNIVELQTEHDACIKNMIICVNRKVDAVIKKGEKHVKKK